MTAFDVPPDAYDRFMGRYSGRLAPRFAEFAGVERGMRVADVGCGPGALTEALADVAGAEAVAAADPSEQFVEGCRARVPGADVRRASAEALPWPDGSFDAVLAQLVVNFMRDAGAGAAEMRRVARPDGVVAACTWDYGGGMRMLQIFWDAAATVDPAAPGESAMPFRRPEELARLWEEAGIAEVETGPLDVEERYESFADWWEPFTYGVGPAGAYCVSADEERRSRVREESRRLLGDPAGAFTLGARAWAVRGRA